MTYVFTLIITRFSVPYLFSNFKVIVPTMESAQLSSNDVKTVEVDGDGVKHNLRIPAIPEIRTSHGLFLTLDLESKNMIFNEANWARMQRSSDVNVVLFRTLYAANLTKLAAGETIMGEFQKNLIKLIYNSNLKYYT